MAQSRHLQARRPPDTSMALIYLHSHRGPAQREDGGGLLFMGTMKVSILFYSILFPGNRFFSFSHLFSDLGLVSGRKEVQVGQKGAGLHHPLVPGLWPLLAEGDVVSQRAVLDPGLLRNVGHKPLQRQPQRGQQVFTHWSNAVQVKDTFEKILW